MKVFSRIAVSAICLAAICGIAIAWRSVKIRKDLEECRSEAERGDAKAQDRLAMLYQQGKGVPQDNVEALKWLRRAAAQGDTRAKYGIGYMFYNGQGVTRDYAEALRWYRQAADAGDAKAQYGVGLLYFYGYSVQQNLTEASRWYRLAADQGLPNAQYDLGYLYFYGLGVSQDRGEARRWFQKAADQGNENAKTALGVAQPRLAIVGQFGLMLVFLASSILIISAMLLGLSFTNPRQRTIASAGLLGLSYVALAIWSLHFDRFRSDELALGGFYFAKNIILGIFAALLISLFWTKISKITLQICVAAFIGLNVYMMVHFGLNFSLPALLLFCSTNGLLIGVLAPLAIFQWQIRAQGRRGGAAKSRF